MAVTMVAAVMEHGPMALSRPPMQQQQQQQQGYGYGSSAMMMPAPSQQIMSMPASLPGMMPQSYSAPGPQTQQTIECAKQQVGKLIGKGGETIQIIQLKSGAKVQIDQHVPEGTPCKINMQGTAHALALAAQIIFEIIANGPNRIMSMPNASTTGTSYPAIGNPMTSMQQMMASTQGRPGMAPQQQQYQQQPYGGQAAAAAYGYQSQQQQQQQMAYQQVYQQVRALTFMLSSQ